MSIIVKLPVVKHGQHDQKTHGNWANGSGSLPAEMEASIKEHTQTVSDLHHIYDAVSGGSGLRRPLVEGGSRWGHGGVYLTRTDLIRNERGHDSDVFSGPFDIYVIRDVQNGAGTIWDGYGTDREWNALSDHIARSVGFTNSSEAMSVPWADRQPYFREVRRTLESRGLDGIQVGGEVVVWNYDKLKPAVTKHGTHDQKTHGNWSTGSSDHGFTPRTREAEIERMMRNFTDVPDLERRRRVAEDLYYRRDYDIYDGPNGTAVFVHIRDASMYENRAEGLERVFNAAAEMQKIAPVKNVEIVIGNNDFRYIGSAASVMGFVVPGEKTIHLRPAVFDNFTPRERHLMPAAYEGNSAAYFLSHEWGHVVDWRDDFQAGSDLQRHRGTLSTYAGGNGREHYAEAFAQWARQGAKIVSDSPDQQVIKWYADTYEWADRVRKAVDSTHPLAGKIIVDTFDLEGGWIEDIEDAPETVTKHGQHDQKTHGNWANGSGVSPEVADARARLEAALTGKQAAEFLDEDQPEDDWNGYDTVRDQFASEWQNGNYKDIQAYLKGDDPRFDWNDDYHYDEDLDEHVGRIIEKADAAYGRLVPLGADVTLHRAADWLPFDPTNVEIGAKVRSSGYTATTTDTDLSAIRITGLGGYLADVRILAPKESKRVLWTGSGGENEAIINHNSTFTVLNVSRGKGVIEWTVDLMLNG
jgi:hypothetical protein